MATDHKPVVIEHDSTAHNQQQETKKRYIKDSGSRIVSIAKLHHLDALLQQEAVVTTSIERATKRELQRKEQRQRNLEQIIKLAHASCKNETAGDPDQDWLSRFFDMAQEIHNSSMQRLWAQVLKREVTNPGSTSMKALKILRDMTPKEAQILQRATTLSCHFGQDSGLKLFIGVKAQNSLFSFSKRNSMITLGLGEFNLPYSTLLVLIELGILHSAELESGEIEVELPILVGYQGKQLSLQVMSKGIRLLYYRFTPTGNELCKLLGHKPNAEYYEQFIAILSQKFIVQSESHHSVDQMI
jgi:uncharacterized repeat protein (TIGR03899 family)